MPGSPFKLNPLKRREKGGSTSLHATYADGYYSELKAQGFVAKKRKGDPIEPATLEIDEGHDDCGFAKSELEFLSPYVESAPTQIGKALNDQFHYRDASERVSRSSAARELLKTSSTRRVVLAYFCSLPLPVFPNQDLTMASSTTLPGQNLPPGFTNVSPSSLAGLAGVIPSAFDGIGSETKHQLALVQFGMLQSMPEHAADIIYSELAAKHLPGLAERFIAETKLMNAPMIVMNSVTHTPYFVRFLTTAAGQDLASIQTKRIAECSDADARG
ncbi:hypothetical protein FA13DRAFT_1785915 [Coprinellus micaceus]|uniref:Uncharacterized protein n=1 Tax=Coprinellus micaceus TaxID=71717 RepID=A0A4Y7TVS5_COPMI|nr:hypothetical protein FA13DRAFT_1785915 [Coprinellus micaceus]